MPSDPELALRRRPRQARAVALVDAVLEAAAQLLANEGSFTMPGVAERAGVSVGSLYQYFPSKAAILFRLQANEWLETTARLRGLLEDADVPPLQRVRALVHAFLRSECEEATLRTALEDAAPRYLAMPEAERTVIAGADAVDALLREALPDADDPSRTLASTLLTRTLASVGRDFSSAPRTPSEIDAFADAMADMFAAYLQRLRET